MRTRTFVFSFFVHSAVIGVAMVVRIFATTELPEPPQNTTFIRASPDVPEVQPPPVRAARPAAALAINREAAPIEEPDSLSPEPFDLVAVAPIGDGVVLGAPGDPAGEVIGPAPPAPAPRVVVPPPPQHVGGVVRAPQKVHHVAPTYPAIAQAARVSGVVIVEALIGEDGSVQDAKVLRSVPLLDAPALEAVRQWRFTPTLLNGVPVQVIMTVTVRFTLN
jgi:periplasmic protein TonB